MKRLLGLIISLLAGLAAIHAMSYEEARDRARFLTDKMAYELNLNEQQYNDAYEINLDYLMNIRTASDVSGVYLEYRNADLRCILYDWQYALFQAATYFIRPVLWRATGWFLPVYTIYAPTVFYYSPPRVYHVYRGGHAFYHHEHRVSYYAHRRPAWHGGLRGESRGPAYGRPAPPPHKPGRPHNPGFRFEPVDKHHPPSRTGRQPDRDRKPGFRFEPVRSKENVNTPGGKRPQAERQRPAFRPTTSGKEGTTARRNNRAGERPAATRYNHPSSTRATVKHAPARRTAPAARQGKTVRQKPNVQKRPARPAGRQSASPVQRHSPEMKRI